jgi:hypothetical protein
MLTPDSKPEQGDCLRGEGPNRFCPSSKTRFADAHQYACSKSTRTLACLNTDHHAPNMIRSYLALAGLLAVGSGCATLSQTEIADLTPALIATGKSFTPILATPETFRAQILVAEVVTNRHGRVEIQRSGYRVDAEYFYPASTVKLCASVAALQLIEELQTEYQTPDLLEVPIAIAPLFPGDLAQTNDPGNLAGGAITVGQEIREIALVSDNQAFNRLFDLIGHEALNRRMHALGLSSVVLNHRLSETRTIPDMFASAAVTFRVPDREPIEVPARRSELRLTNSAARLTVGNGYWQGQQLVNSPMEFHRRNGISVVDLQNLLIKVVRPDINLGTPPLKLTAAHREMLVQAMTIYPRESKNPVYAADRFPDDYSKFMLSGIRRVFPSAVPGERVAVTGKLGRAYGFSIDNSYVRNPKTGRAVFVTAVLYTNSDGILNDEKYDYATIADPFFADLGEFVARRWLGAP